MTLPRKGHLLFETFRKAADGKQRRKRYMSGLTLLDAQSGGSSCRRIMLVQQPAEAGRIENIKRIFRTAEKTRITRRRSGPSVAARSRLSSSGLLV
jgi:hypothetical protein